VRESSSSESIKYYIYTDTKKENRLRERMRFLEKEITNYYNINSLIYYKLSSSSSALFFTRVCFNKNCAVICFFSSSSS